jgi:hypothetical protein
MRRSTRAGHRRFGAASVVLAIGLMAAATGTAPAQKHPLQKNPLGYPIKITTPWTG